MALLVRSRRRLMTRSAPVRRSRAWIAQVGSLPFEGTPADPDCVHGPLFTVGQLGRDDKTLVRLRGFWAPVITTAGASSSPIWIWAGIGVQNEKAVAGDALPCPYSDGDWGGWLWQSQMVLNTANPSVLSATNSPALVIDGRGMRRVQEDDEVFLAVEIWGRPGDTDVNVSFAVRGLFLE